MLVVPLVFISLTAGAMSMKDVKKLGRAGSKTLSF
jgi:Na+/H+-dicarboxylate symporter